MNFNISFHPLFILLCCVFIYYGYVGLLCSYLLCLIIHELAHALMASRFGYRLNHIKMMPHGASIGGNNMYFSYRDEIFIALAGPLSNFVLCILVLSLWWLFPISYVYTLDFFVANLVVGTINLLPVYPLDGGRVLLALLSRHTSRIKAVKIIKIIGIILSFAIILWFVVTTFFVPNFTVLFFGIFLFVTSLCDTRNIGYMRVNNLEYKLSRVNRGIAMRNIAVNQDITLYKLFSQISPFYLTNFTVIDGDMHILGQISEKQLNHLITIYPANIRLKVILSQMLA